MVRWLRAWLFGAGPEPSLPAQLRAVWQSKAIRTGPADPRRQEYAVTEHRHRPGLDLHLRVVRGPDRAA